MSSAAPTAALQLQTFEELSDEDGYDVRIHFRGGTTEVVHITEEHLEDENCHTIEAYLEWAGDHAGPQWFWFGDTHMSGQANSAFTILSDAAATC